jgi:hypothetical protein
MFLLVKIVVVTVVVVVVVVVELSFVSVDSCFVIVSLTSVLLGPEVSFSSKT